MVQPVVVNDIRTDDEWREDNAMIKLAYDETLFNAANEYDRLA